MLDKLKKRLHLFKAYKELKEVCNEKKYIFIFPFYHTGGAERVHINILNAFKKSETLCIISETSKNENFKDDFIKASTIFTLDEYNLNYRYKRKLLKRFANNLVRTNVTVVFGSNTILFYDFIEHISADIKKIDLYHAFSYENPNALEHQSIYLVNTITNRVVLGNHTYNDFKELYKKNNISHSYLNRIKTIKNSIDIPHKFQIKDFSAKKNILFVGRNSTEKRPELLFEIIAICNSKNLDFHFYIIGDFIEIKNSYNFPNLTFLGEIKNQEEIASWYKKSHLLLITSSREGLPMVILEGMSHGVIPISTDVGEISELITTENGFLIRNYADESKIVSTFLATLSNINDNPEKLNQLSSNCYESVKKTYNTERFVSEYNSLFKI